MWTASGRQPYLFVRKIPYVIEFLADLSVAQRKVLKRVAESITATPKTRFN